MFYTGEYQTTKLEHIYLLIKNTEADSLFFSLLSSFLYEFDKLF
jgi:hypothetical protein